MPSADWRIDLGIGRGVHHSHLVDQGIGQETVEWVSGQLIEVQLVEAYRHIEGSKPTGFLDNRVRVQLEGCIPVEIHQSRVGQELCLYPTEIKSAHRF